MSFKSLYILIEGNDDERFFSSIIVPLLEKKYDHIKLWKYSPQKKDKICKLVISINSMKSDLIFLADFDQGPCISHIKNTLKCRYKYIPSDCIFIVKKEIESWYLAGLKCTEISRLFDSHPKTTNELSKEDFEKSLPKRFKSRLDYMIELLKKFDIDRALQNNESFSRFIKLYCEYTHYT